MKEYCGIMGVYNHTEATKLVYFGLYAQQHRGQESAGITAWDGTKISDKRVFGLASSNFTENDFISNLKGHIAIGHVSSKPEKQAFLSCVDPFIIKYKGTTMVAALNGGLTNSQELRDLLENDGGVLRSDSDSELFLHLIVRNLHTMSEEQAVLAAARQLKGAFSFLLMIKNRIYVVRDTFGFKPLALAQYGESIIIASETCAFDLIEAKYIRDVEPGEVLIIDEKNMRSLWIDEDIPTEQRKRAHCIFEFVYSARPDSLIFGQNVYMVRQALGMKLAQEHPVDADLVLPFPDSGIYSAVGFAKGSGLPYEHAMIRNHYVGRTFIQPTQNMRDFSVRIKINPVREVIEGKRIVIVDDSIVRGTTMDTRVKKLRELGAKEIHCRISSPKVIASCPYGVDFASKGELIASKYSTDEIRQKLGLDSLGYLSIPGMLETLNRPKDYCTACFDANYPLKWS
ncbi:amidophosphoribosyltransferase [Desulfovibrio litoralis]|uniref:Amidophosphoribosyltransferase n=1 Tax=Desulfovibrio litoralis DSM 11393 TaxID=1121455 RepID=A0A1M7T6N4_9BACT|nr:amidophosphoribosyltransferase [Desulfovibrio litoralis DSM 11393]